MILFFFGKYLTCFILLMNFLEMSAWVWVLYKLVLGLKIHCQLGRLDFYCTVIASLSVISQLMVNVNVHVLPVFRWRNGLGSVPMTCWHTLFAPCCSSPLLPTLFRAELTALSWFMPPVLSSLPLHLPRSFCQTQCSPLLQRFWPCTPKPEGWEDVICADLDYNGLQISFSSLTLAKFIDEWKLLVYVVCNLVFWNYAWIMLNRSF